MDVEPALCRRETKKIDSMIDRKIRDGLAAWVEEKGYREGGLLPSDLARRLDVEPEQLSAFFSLYMGCSFKEWRKRLRIKDAQKMLLEKPSLPVSRVGYTVGISDHSDFRRQFTDVTGCTPSEWRSINRGVLGWLRLLFGKIKVAVGNRIRL